MKFFTKLLLMLVLSVSFLSVYAANQDSKPLPEKTIGIVLPMDHAALRTIVDGFKAELSKNYPGKVNFLIQNAEHDINIQRSIIQKFINQKIDMIVPVGTTTTQMAVSMVTNQPIVALAAMIPNSVRNKNNLANCFTGIRDEIDSGKQIAFIHLILPNLKKLTLIYSADDKVVPEVKAAIAAAKELGITIQPLMIQNLSDLYSASQRISKDSQAIFILKDNLIVSGINTLVFQAKQRHIPLITSDEGSVSHGAGTALGVEEKQIGVEGGELAAKILNGQQISQLPIQEMKTLLVFINSKTASEQELNIEDIKSAAKQQNYSIRIY